MYRTMSNNKPSQYNVASYMSRILDPCMIRARQPTRKRMLWTDDLHKIFVKAVAYHGGPHAAKPSAVMQTMEAMGVTSLTIHNIKSHLQKYRHMEKCGLGAGAPDNVPGTTSPSKAALNLMSEMMVDTDAVMAEIEVVTQVNNFLMDDVEMVEKNFSVDELQTMEEELMTEIQLMELNSQIPQSTVDEYMDGLANHASISL